MSSLTSRPGLAPSRPLFPLSPAAWAASSALRPLPRPLSPLPSPSPSPGSFRPQRGCPRCPLPWLSPPALCHWRPKPPAPSPLGPNANSHRMRCGAPHGFRRLRIRHLPHPFSHAPLVCSDPENPASQCPPVTQTSKPAIRDPPPPASARPHTTCCEDLSFLPLTRPGLRGPGEPPLPSVRSSLSQVSQSTPALICTPQH